jgi:hypothetical protein
MKYTIAEVNRMIEKGIIIPTLKYDGYEEEFKWDEYKKDYLGSKSLKSLVMIIRSECHLDDIKTKKLLSDI